MNINALGFVEVLGLVASVEAADAMLKTADVRLLGVHKVDPGLITVAVEGDLAACRAAVNAGRDAAMRMGQVLAAHVIGRPDDDTETMLLAHIPHSMRPPTSGGTPSSTPLTPKPMAADETVLEDKKVQTVTPPATKTIVKKTRTAVAVPAKARQAKAASVKPLSKQMKAAKQGQALAQAAHQWANALIGEMSDELSALDHPKAVTAKPKATKAAQVVKAAQTPKTAKKTQ